MTTADQRAAAGESLAFPSAPPAPLIDSTQHSRTTTRQNTREMVHDLKNLLTPLLGYIQLVLHDMPRNDTQYRRIEKIHRAAMSARNLVLHALEETSGKLSPKSLDLNGRIRAFVETVDGMIPPGVRLELDLAAGVGDVVADAGDIQRVLMNLIANACQVMPRGGALRIQTARIASSTNVVRISVQDTGCGIAPEAVERIFESGYTTKPGGNGLGMTCVRRIARQYGGWVDINSIPGAGTAVHVFLPRGSSVVPTSRAG